jgi:hypothetical protein
MREEKEVLCAQAEAVVVAIFLENARDDDDAAKPRI